MDFDLTAEQEMFRKMAREFAERELVPVFAGGGPTPGFPYEVYRKMAPLGLLGTLIPPEYGGIGVGVLTWSVIREQLAWGSLTHTQATQGGMLAGTILMAAGSEEQKKEYLPPLCRGERLYAMAAAEPNAGTDGGNIETTAALEGDLWVLNGNKVMITNANVADMILVLAQTDKSKGGRGLALFMVGRGTPGLSTSPASGLLGLPCGDLGQVRLTDCRIPAANLINEVGKGLRIALGGISNMRVAIGADCVGVAQRCIDICVKYAQDRQQFGKPIGSYQLVQELIAEMEVETEAARWLTRRAAYNRDKGLPAIREVSMAKLFASEMVVRTTLKGIRIHGGYGSFEDYTVARLHREATTVLAPGGTSEVHKLTIARSSLGIDALSR